MPASIFRRLGAFVYDSFIVFSFLLLITGIALLLNRGHSFQNIRFFFLAYLFISTGLFVTWFWQRSGQTLGMLAWKIKCVDTNNEILSWKKAFARFTLACIFGGLGVIWCLFDRDKQSLHDRLLRTKLIRI